MHYVNQLTPFTCGLACIESVATDFNIQTSQAKLLVDYKHQLLADARKLGDFGSASPTMMTVIWQALGIKGQWLQDHNVPDFRQNVLATLNHNREAILFFADFQKNGWHCIRFEALDGQNGIKVMVPVFQHATALPMTITGQDLVDWGFFYAKLTH